MIPLDSRRISSLGLLAAVWALTSGCPQVVLPPEGQRLSRCPTDTRSAPDDFARQAAPARARVYLDVSGSMRGFAEQDDSVFGLFLADLRSVLLDLRIENAELWRVGETVDRADRDSFSSLDRRDYFTASETNLAAALQQEIDLTDGQTPLTVLVSDGVTSLRDSARSDSLVDCEQGSDIDCLVAKVQELQDRRAGFWIVGIRSMFSGPLYSEKLGSKNLGTLDDLRPFYLWIFADHPPTARRFITRLASRIRPRTEGDAWFAVEVFPGEVPWRRHHPSTETETSRRLLASTSQPGGVVGAFEAPARAGAASLEVFTRELHGDSFGVRVPLESPAGFEPVDGITPMSSYDAAYCLRWEPASLNLPVDVTAMPDRDALELAFVSPALRQLVDVGGTLVQRIDGQRRPSRIVDRLDSWSTRDDSELDDGTLTLNLVQFFQGLEARLAAPPGYEQAILQLDFNRP